jgi:hypothetical protein
VTLVVEGWVDRGDVPEAPRFGPGVPCLEEVFVLGSFASSVSALPLGALAGALGPESLGVEVVGVTLGVLVGIIK